MHTKFYSSPWFLKKENIFTFSRSKMNANYAEIFRVGTYNLVADFQQVPLV